MLRVQPLHDAVYMEAMRALSPNWNNIESWFIKEMFVWFVDRTHIYTHSRAPCASLDHCSTGVSSVYGDSREHACLRFEHALFCVFRAACGGSGSFRTHRSIFPPATAQTLRRQFSYDLVGSTTREHVSFDAIVSNVPPVKPIQSSETLCTYRFLSEEDFPMFSRIFYPRKHLQNLMPVQECSTRSNMKKENICRSRNETIN